MPRFVVLEHDWPNLHWDLFLECGEILRAWRLLSEPTMGQLVTASVNLDHRKYYLEYEGPISDDRGKVVRWDSGCYKWIEDTTARTVIEFRGGKLLGLYQLETSAAGELVFGLKSSSHSSS